MDPRDREHEDDTLPGTCIEESMRGAIAEHGDASEDDAAPDTIPAPPPFGRSIPPASVRFRD